MLERWSTSGLLSKSLFPQYLKQSNTGKLNIYATRGGFWKNKGFKAPCANTATGQKVVFCFLSFSLYVTKSCLPCFQNLRDLSAEARPLAQCRTSVEKRKSTSHNQKSLMLQFPLCGRDTAVGKQEWGGYERQMSFGLSCSKRNAMKRVPRCPLGWYRGGASLSALVWRSSASPQRLRFAVSVRAGFGVGANRSVRRAAAESSCQSLTSKLAAFTFHLRSPETAWPEWSYRNVLSRLTTRSFRPLAVTLAAPYDKHRCKRRHTYTNCSEPESV